jgi:hypothetical protein
MAAEGARAEQAMEQVLALHACILWIHPLLSPMFPGTAFHGFAVIFHLVAYFTKWKPVRYKVTEASCWFLQGNRELKTKLLPAARRCRRSPTF